ncbi:MAG: hypothetical protein PHR82_07120, partial [Endomicrobiaceae bacterium]|nr:hypothetical protein [Endomicrobiaceae bacterium]
DTESVKAFLEKVKQDNKYKQEIEDLRKAKLELEERLKTATKQEYELKLSEQAQEQVEQQKQRAIELNKMALKAKEDYIKAENEQKQKELKRQEEFNALKKKIEQEQLEMQNKIVQEKDEIRKAELENQAKIKELENKAKENMAGWDTTKQITIQQALEEVKRIKKDVSETISKFETLLITNKEKLAKSYNTQIEILKSGIFLQEKPVKDKWETTEQFKKRLQEYEIQKQKFLETSQERATELEEAKEEVFFQDGIETLQSMITTTKPFIAKLQKFQKEYFYDKDKKQAEILSLGQVNADEKYFSIKLKYNNKKYEIKFDFSDIGLQQARLIYQTPNQLIIEPLFSIEEAKEIFPVITAFNVKHLGIKLEKTIELSTESQEFTEIIKLKIYEKKLKEIETFKGKIIVSISAGSSHTVGLKKDGTVVAVGDNNYGQCDVNGWENIIAISAGSDYTVGLKKDGRVVAVGNNLNGQCNVKNWKDVVATDSKHTLRLKKDGRVVAVGDNSFGQCNVKNWKDIVAISAGRSHTVGLKKDGTVVAVGDNRSGQCDVSGWALNFSSIRIIEY